MRSFAVVLLALAACANSTPRALPSGAVPASWESGTSTSSASSVAWWRVFEDPVLDRLIERARAQNLDLKIAEARIREARAGADAAGADLWPSLDASAGTSVARGKGGDFKLGLDASWEADLFGRLRSEERAAVADFESISADREAVELLLLGEVAGAYIEYRLRRVQLSLAEKTVAAQESTVRIARARFEQGTASRFDLERTLAALALTRARIPEAFQLAAAARHRLSLLLAEPVEAINAELAGDKPLPDSDPRVALASPAEVVARRPDVRSAEWRLRSALATRDATEALRYPRLTLSGLVGLESGSIDELFDPASIVASLAAGLFAPLVDFGRIRAQIEIADARQEQADLDYERTVRTAIQETQTAIISYAQGVTKQKELGNALTSARKAADFARIQYQEGTLSLLEVLDAERSLNDAELSWSQATADLSVRLIAVHRTMGG